MQSKLQEVPNLINTLLNAYVAIGRIEEFMREPEKEIDSRASTNRSSFRLDNCSFSWPNDPAFVIRNVNLAINKGLTVVHGKVGVGKTAFLEALLGELDKPRGVCEVPAGMIGYCAQTPWLQSMSIRENILFFSQYEEERYQRVLEACALLPDLASFKDGDESLIGENGIGLSGGQKARVALSRAVYSRSKVLLLDDPLSALDHNTAEFIVQKCFAGPLLDNRAVVLVTHRTSLVRHLAVSFVEISDGEVTTYAAEAVMGRDSLHSVDDAGPDPTNSEVPISKHKDEGTAPNKFIEDEKREHGGVKPKVVWMYIKFGGLTSWLLLVSTMALTRIATVGTTWFYKAWGEAYNEKEATVCFGLPEYQSEIVFGQSNITKPCPIGATSYLPDPDDLTPWLVLMLFFTLATSLSNFLYRIVQVTIIYVSAKKVFRQVIEHISNATFRFYDVTPIGRLMNRLTADMQTVDMAMFYIGPLILNGMSWAASFIVIASVTPISIVFSIALVAIFVTVFLRFLPTSQALKRMETVSLSPLFTNFGELLQGLATVRAFQAQKLFQARITRVVDKFQAMNHFYWSLQTWLMFRFEILSSLSTFALTVIALQTGLSPGLTAFMLTNATAFMSATHRICKRYGDLQTDLVSVERVMELLEIEQEPPGSIKPPASWPKLGSDVVFENVTIRYAEHLDPVLKGISLCIPRGSKTAIVGRTGSGKSTLAASLLKIVNPDADGGVIKIDNVSLAEVETAALRQRLAFVAQDPVLFSGTIRHNLDPLYNYTDEQCAAVLGRICAQQGWALDTQIESGGRNLSQGQRQLIGITRAVLRRSAVIVLDEATASVDLETSMEIQGILREEMKDATVITIAHRVEAVKDADFVVILDNGRVTASHRNPF